MNMNQIANALTRNLKLNPTQESNLTQSIAKAKEILNSVSNPTDALAKANVDPSFFGKVREYLNNPMYSFLLPMLGIDKKVALQKLDSLEKMMSTDRTASFPNESIQSSPKLSPSDDLERFRKGLNSFK